MNARAALLTVVLASLSGQSAWAHENHTHHPARPELGEEQAKTRAREEVERLVSVKKVLYLFLKPSGGYVAANFTGK